MRPAVKLEDFIKGGGKLPAGLNGAAGKRPADRTADRADRERHQAAMRAMQRENAALRLEILKLRRARALGRYGAEAARRARQIESHRAWVADRVMLLLTGTALAILFLFGGNWFK